MNFHSKVAWVVSLLVALVTGFITWYVSCEVTPSVAAGDSGSSGELLIAQCALIIISALVWGTIALLIGAAVSGKRNKNQQNKKW